MVQAPTVPGRSQRSQLPPAHGALQQVPSAQKFEAQAAAPPSRQLWPRPNLPWHTPMTHPPSGEQSSFTMQALGQEPASPAHRNGSQTGDLPGAPFGKAMQLPDWLSHESQPPPQALSQQMESTQNVETHS